MEKKNNVIKVDFKAKVVIQDPIVSTEVYWAEGGTTGHVIVEKDGETALRVDFDSDRGLMWLCTGNPVWLPLALRTLSRFNDNELVFGKYSPQSQGEVGLLEDYGFVLRDGLMIRDAKEAWPKNMVETLSQLERDVTRCVDYL